MGDLYVQLTLLSITVKVLHSYPIPISTENITGLQAVNKCLTYQHHLGVSNNTVCCLPSATGQTDCCAGIIGLQIQTNTTLLKQSLPSPR